jgi:hypothetical protein
MRSNHPPPQTDSSVPTVKKPADAANLVFVHDDAAPGDVLRPLAALLIALAAGKGKERGDS